MEVAKRLAVRFWKWEYAWLSLIVVGTLVLHLVVIARPAEPLFDEQHYIPDARNIIERHGTARTEHPPLAKLAMVSGILVFGDNPYGWRIPSVVFGTLGIVFFYLMCRRLNLPRRAATIGTFILATENLYFVHSGIAMLDIFTVSLTILAFWLYARRSYPHAVVAVALSTLAKLTGVFSVIAVFGHWIVGRRDKPVEFVASLILAPLAFMLLLAAFDAVIYLRLVDFISNLRYGLEQTAGLTFESAKHVSMSRPWEWVFNLEIMPYWYGPHFIGVVSFSVWALTVPAVAYTAFMGFWKKDSAALFVIAWFIGTYAVWIPLSLVTNRVSFIFYFLPTVPAICLGLGMALDQLIAFWQGRTRVPTATGRAAATADEAPPVAESRPPRTGRSPRRWTGLRWAAISFVGLFFLVHLATFLIVAPPLNNWPIETWFR